MYIICGLGNPGKEYETTRHNMGFMTVDAIAEKLGVRVSQLKFRALLGEGRVNGEKVILVKPQTYMNLSGGALRPVMEYYRVEPSHLIVVYDDADLAVGALRIRASGSSGSHNGMKSVIYQLQTQDFARVRVGIGSRGVIPMDRFVLGHPDESEMKLIKDAVNDAADACLMFVREGLDKAMNRYNTAKTNASSVKNQRVKPADDGESSAE